MRGKPASIAAAWKSTGLIPAHAGKTRLRAVSPFSSPAHPRACGENLPTASPRATKGGSSPRMRGKPPDEVGRGVGDGLIPAHAGKTLARCALGVDVEAHPRACGENTQVGILSSLSMGSSPRMRGKLKVCSRAFSWPGLIPAHAGKTFLPTTHFRGQGAHPRACGEN